MRHVTVCIGLALCGAFTLGVSFAADQAPATEPALWQHHQELINYYGVTETYTCTGIEERVRQVLLYFGARRDDLKVSPLCSQQFAPMHQVFVRVDFSSLSPTASGTGNEVPGYWVDLHVMPSDALFRDRGECELFQNMKDLLTKDFTVRNVEYVTTCTPNDTTLQDYKIVGQVLAPPGQPRDVAKALR